MCHNCCIFIQIFKIAAANASFILKTEQIYNSNCMQDNYIILRTFSVNFSVNFFDFSILYFSYFLDWKYSRSRRTFPVNVSRFLDSGYKRTFSFKLSDRVPWYPYSFLCESVLDLIIFRFWHLKFRMNTPQVSCICVTKITYRWSVSPVCLLTYLIIQHVTPLTGSRI